MTASGRAPLASLTDAAGGVAILRIERPEKANSLDIATARELSRLLDEVATRGRVRALVLAGAGARFCSGGDLASVVGAGSLSERLGELVDAVGDVVRRLAASRVPVVAAVQGAVAGAGVGLALCCDAVVAAAGTRFVAAYSSVGLTPDCGTSWLLTQTVGPRRAQLFALHARGLQAEEAQRWGIVDFVVDDGSPVDAALEMARSLAHVSPYAVGQTRRLMREAVTSGFEASIADERATIIAALGQDGTVEALRARFAPG
jgi:2-(1,2-epoxy-1,2-dihydrophenyl)acetyl-CoA isomerase